MTQPSNDPQSLTQGGQYDATAAGPFSPVLWWRKRTAPNFGPRAHACTWGLMTQSRALWRRGPKRNCSPLIPNVGKSSVRRWMHPRSPEKLNADAIEVWGLNFVTFDVSCTTPYEILNFEPFEEERDICTVRWRIGSDTCRWPARFPVWMTQLVSYGVIRLKCGCSDTRLSDSASPVSYVMKGKGFNLIISYAVLVLHPDSANPLVITIMKGTGFF